MKYRTLGRTKLKVSEIGFGAWAIGGGFNVAGLPIGYGPTKDEESIAAIKKALELGVNFIDTADSYGKGKSEILIGQTLKDLNSDCIIATKVGNKRRDPEPITQDFSKDHILHSIDKSLERLQVSTIDLYQLHNPPKEVRESDVPFNILNKLKDKGKIRFIGVSIFGPEEGIYLIENNKTDTLQLAYSILNQEHAKELFKLAKRKNIGIIVREPLANGMLTGKFSLNSNFPNTDIRSERYSGKKFKEVLEKVEKLKFLLENHKTLAQAALRFALSSDEVSVIIPGAKNPKQVEDNVKASEKDLSIKELNTIKGLYNRNFNL